MNFEFEITVIGESAEFLLIEAPTFSARETVELPLSIYLFY